MIESQIKQLLAGVAAEADLHLAEAEADIDQVGQLLAEAIERLGSAFLGIHEDIGAQQELIGECTAGSDRVRLQKELAALRERLAVNISAAVTGLQFQDMVSQILVRAQKRVAGVRDALVAVGAGADSISAGTDMTEAAQHLGSLHSKLAITSRQLDTRLRKQVDQKRLDSGDIELF